MTDTPWLLPAGVDDLLPDEARRLEGLRRAVLDLFDAWGYELVVTPLVEYLDSLLVGSGSDLELQTFKLIDQLNGRLMGVRADMTPQAARIDAHRLRRPTPTRLCYLDTVLHTLPDGFAGTRSPLQVGAELYGHAGPESDAEVLCLMIEALRVMGLDPVYVDLGHVAVLRELARAAGLSAAEESEWLGLLERKAVPELAAFAAARRLPPALAEALVGLAELDGDEPVLDEARRRLAPLGDALEAALDHLAAVAERVQRRLPGVRLHYDLGEPRGYRYQNGVVFAAYVPGHGRAVARGGRYDDIGRVFGAARPATGFSADLRSVLALGNAAVPPRPAVWAPAVDDPALLAAVAELRARGERVIEALPGQVEDPAAQGCDRRLILRDGAWRVEPLAAGRE